MHLKRTFSALTACVLLTGCFGAKKTLDTSYYLIEFAPTARNPKLIVKEPLPYKVQVLTLKIPRSYDSIRIIARYSSHQINYYRYSLWAVRPQIAVADLIAQQINTYRLFKDCQREFLDERPDYEISGDVTQIERFESQDYTAVHLKMELDFSDYNSKDILVVHQFDREVPIPNGSMTIFAKAVSDLLDEQSEVFLGKVLDYFQNRPADSTHVQPPALPLGTVGK